ncbi:hypothetical protein NLG97_g1995 [Lecanicillium saksenae]|uniref:Uncharacterized protein n=1 Tax=Lecanicillium saksenae TaxID=468837 RepID=A0ACC1R3K4_9HYPO|nr:hypothetical protein NLG97_g1995 [Lecanicillium saksenae]
MVSESSVRRSNALISSSLFSSVTAVFVGGTSGVGRCTLIKLAKYSKNPRIYLVGRSQSAADEVITECNALNPQGRYTFIQGDVSLVRGVDTLCQAIKDLETSIDLLFLSPGVLKLDRSVTTENIHHLAALNYYCRMRIITSLLPLIQVAQLRRVVTVAGGGHEGSLDFDDLQALRVPLSQLRSHLSTMITLGLEALVSQHPKVSFIHSYPGSVATGLYRDLDKPPFDPASVVSVDECGERQLYIATSARYSPKGGLAIGVHIQDSTPTLGSNGEVRSGVYTLRQDCESADENVLHYLSGLRETGAVERVWQHTSELLG